MRKNILISALFLIFLLSGCYDYNELNMQELVSGVGVDIEDGLVSVSVQCASTDEGDGAIYRATGKSFFDAVRNISLHNPKKLYWGHTQTLIIGESAIREAEPVFNAILRARDIYLDIIPIVAKGAAGDIIAAKAANGDAASDALFKAFANEKNSKRFRSVRLWELLRERSEKGIYSLPTVELKDGFPSFSGGAVLRENGDAVYLSGEQILLLSLLSEDEGGGYLPPIAIEGAETSFEILAQTLRHQESKSLLHLVLSPAEVSGELDSVEAEAAVRLWLDSSFEKFLAFLSKNDIAALANGITDVTAEVRISDILGGRR